MGRPRSPAIRTSSLLSGVLRGYRGALGRSSARPPSATARRLRALSLGSLARPLHRTRTARGLALLRSASGNASLLRRLPPLRSRSVVPPVASAPVGTRSARYGRQRGIFYLRCRLRRPLILQICVVLYTFPFAYISRHNNPCPIDSPQSGGASLVPRIGSTAPRAFVFMVSVSLDRFSYLQKTCCITYARIA